MPVKTRKPARVAEGLTPTEVAYVTGLSPKAVNATVDKGELPITTRRFGPAEVAYLVVREQTAQVLSSKARSEVYDCLLHSRIGKSWKWTEPDSDAGSDIQVRLSDGVVLVIQVKFIQDRLAKRIHQLHDIAAHVVSDAEIRGGEPVIAGTRVPVYMIADLKAQGASTAEILEDYPRLDAVDVKTAVAYAAIHPRRGRPRTAPWKHAE